MEAKSLKTPINADSCTPMNADVSFKVTGRAPVIDRFVTYRHSTASSLSAAIGARLSAFIGVFKDLP
jgi:hypothetical protein